MYYYSINFSSAVASRTIEFWLPDYELPSNVETTALNFVESITVNHLVMPGFHFVVKD